MNPHDDSSADDLRPVVDLLRACRPEATALELDAVKQRVRRRAAGDPARRRARSAPLMKSRLAILGMLVAGMLLSTTGAGIAVTSLSGNDASVAQYGGQGGDGGSGDNGDTLGEGAQGGPTPSKPSTPSTNAGTPTTPTTTAVQPARQVESGAGGSQLPFTGFLAIPVLLGGVALLGAGLVLRRQSASDRS
jgi:hypothetical protein